MKIVGATNKQNAYVIITESEMTEIGKRVEDALRQSLKKFFDNSNGDAEKEVKKTPAKKT